MKLIGLAFPPTMTAKSAICQRTALRGSRRERSDTVNMGSLLRYGSDHIEATLLIVHQVT